MPRRHALDAVETPSGAVFYRNIRIGSHWTSLRIDPFTWRLLKEVAQRERVTVHELCTAINSEKPSAFNLTVAIRVAVLRYYHDAATENGHAKAGQRQKAELINAPPARSNFTVAADEAYPDRKSPGSKTRLFPGWKRCDS